MSKRWRTRFDIDTRDHTELAITANNIRGVREGIRLMREQSGTLMCLECNLVLPRPRVRCPNCHHPYRVGRCSLCQRAPIVLNPLVSDRGPTQPACLTCWWPGLNAFRHAATASAPLGFLSWLGCSLAPLVVVKYASSALSARLPPSPVLQQLTAVAGIAIAVSFIVVSSSFLKRFFRVHDFPTENNAPLAWILRATPSLPRQPLAEKWATERLADVRSLGDALKCFAWSLADLSLLFLILALWAAPRWWDVVLGLLGAVLVVKYLARMLATFLSSTSWYHARGWLLAVDDAFFNAPLFIAFVYVVGTIGVTYDALKERKRPRTH